MTAFLMSRTATTMGMARMTSVTVSPERAGAELD